MTFIKLRLFFSGIICVALIFAKPNRKVESAFISPSISTRCVDTTVKTTTSKITKGTTHTTHFLSSSASFAGGEESFNPNQKVEASSGAVSGADSSGTPNPTSFREAEVLGLRLMQEGRHEDALKAFKNGLKLQGSRVDVVRTKSLPGPSPVGGASGGTETQTVLSLDEFELQAAHYNIACACARLGKVAETTANLRTAFENGFDNYATVRSDPDLSSVHETPEFIELMEEYDPKKGMKFPNPFANIFSKK